MNFKQIISEKLNQALGQQVSNEKLEQLIEKPKDLARGDYAFPTFFLAKQFHQAPQHIAADVVKKLNADGFEKIEAVGPYINFFIQRDQFTSRIIKQILTQADFGKNQHGAGKNIVIDLSSPNIAKPMSMGHLRSTVIGEAISKIAQANGYHTIKINFLGDWGTQFGLMIASYKRWGNDQVINANPVDELVKLYVRINNEAQTKPELKDEGRHWFKKLEDGDPEATKLWSWFKEVSLKEFQTIYDRLGVTFDSMNGESFYNDKMEPVVQLLADKGLLTKSQGAEIVDLPKLLPDANFPIAMIKRSDGATQYITRDLASAIYRQDHYHFDKALYVVGAEQKDHFEQMKAVLRLAGDGWADNIEHIGFGLITMNGKKMSTRKGNIVPLVDVLDAAHKLAAEQIAKKNPDLQNAEQIAEEVGTGAVIFNDLQNDRNLAIDFNLEDIVQFEGDTGPYVQYTHVRAMSILRKAAQPVDSTQEIRLADSEAWGIVAKLSEYGSAIQRAWQLREPSIIAKYLLNLAREFNSYYANTKILVADMNLNSRLALVKSVADVLASGLKLLGVAAPNKM
ncbi:arginine--tRNA ligase [Oenococcus kitaharae]|uniref:Arginine--tRNA ligase n=1 Tax=Oenococcus kitaharae DSM 17330 TaxID=1045004 RepID=G9WG51_9LACO|nr:arginine--tRNA ligase [Oenococcus kitaharae]EHN59629.1 Arginyl-tRNA synthetase [Oenococcus kitaharae DSM 17330]OEY83473.1 arginine--tRNA ligase [Oenococcus kitaharae]OEY85272.1 arginine--tRNA ligase [Oenococcus kitaharae]OEY86126.1 arginine--tRNA ligase [Oenococcus kitaharae]